MTPFEAVAKSNLQRVVRGSPVTLVNVGTSARSVSAVTQKSQPTGAALNSSGSRYSPLRFRRCRDFRCYVLLHDQTTNPRGIFLTLAEHGLPAFALLFEGRKEAREDSLLGFTPVPA